MLAKVSSMTVIGIDGFSVEVEVDLSPGLPSFDVVGLADTAVKEAKERVRAAIKNSQFDFPSHRIVINLAPADLKKEGSGFDLPIALGILCAQGFISQQTLNNGVVIGELALDGEIRTVRGVLSMVIEAVQRGKEFIILPLGNYAEARVVKGIKIIPIKYLQEAVEFLQTGNYQVEPLQGEETVAVSIYNEDFSDVRGQEATKRALEIAAAGGHNILLVGPPGSGKTMLARRLPSILPELNWEEALELTKIYSISGLLPAGASLLKKRPFRSPHHTTSKVGLIGGGAYPRPGEVTLAHYGVLFLDELPEFHREALEVLRQPLEDGMIFISRAALSLTYPSRFMLVGAMNPCLCGFYRDPVQPCSCTPAQIKRYTSRISGPLLDRIDFTVEVPRLKYEEMAGVGNGEPSAVIRRRVVGARKIQEERFKGRGIYCNAHMGPKETKYYCSLGKEGKGLMASAVQNFRLSARGYGRLLKVARTIADLEGKTAIDTIHLAEAIQYRGIDRLF
jgi:magnesium chelatase family protein